MAIEFPCLNCGRTLRANSASSGKDCRCPHCQSINSIPFEIVDEADEPMVLEIADNRLRTPCPSCKSQLEYTEELIGTRGLCKKCGEIFTLPPPGQKLAEKTNSGTSDVFAFSCPKCSQLFEGKSGMEGKRGKCHVCSEQFKIVRNLSIGSAAEPTSASNDLKSRSSATPPIEPQLTLQLEPAPSQPNKIAESSAKPIDSPRIEFPCQTCQTLLRAPKSAAGKLVECPSCKQRMAIPQSPASKPKPVNLFAQPTAQTNPIAPNPQASPIPTAIPTAIPILPVTPSSGSVNMFADPTPPLDFGSYPAAIPTPAYAVQGYTADPYANSQYAIPQNPAPLGTPLPAPGAGANPFQPSMHGAHSQASPGPYRASLENVFSRTAYLYPRYFIFLWIPIFVSLGVTYSTLWGYRAVINYYQESELDLPIAVLILLPLVLGGITGLLSLLSTASFAQFGARVCSMRSVSFADLLPSVATVLWIVLGLVFIAVPVGGFLFVLTLISAFIFDDTDSLSATVFAQLITTVTLSPLVCVCYLTFLGVGDGKNLFTAFGNALSISFRNPLTVLVLLAILAINALIVSGTDSLAPMLADPPIDGFIEGGLTLIVSLIFQPLVLFLLGSTYCIAMSSPGTAQQQGRSGPPGGGYSPYR